MKSFVDIFLLAHFDCMFSIEQLLSKLNELLGTDDTYFEFVYHNCVTYL